ncbi:hypothetical protein MAXJ12_06315 [Mesorhizobium alhagi CCNWXJ12-2]|uniref:DNA primase/polymerase bifunctional N-terminal domain-containing protein n=2 Tax=Allomesorhizobium alhagi TaxID=475067 RepID=H0HM99_9HYPH|nr:hypothetical protein MAXJ12_06315 [Mesorhizobium alhagi CCNWXJ12-2]
MKEITALRLTLLANGYAPLASIDKLCVLPNWPRSPVDEALITRRWARMRRYTATGIRVENGLAVIDLDVDNVPAMAELAERLKGILPGAFLLCRHGKGAKIALFVRTAEPFKRICSKRWLKPGDTAEGGAHGAEIFGGASARYFGAFGWHTLDRIKYRWAGNSPADTPLDRLPVFTKKQFFAAIDAIECILRRRGWQVVERSVGGENVAHRVHDLVEGMAFECNDGVTRTLSELQEMARLDAVQGLRCSASWLEGPTAKRTDRCLIGHTATGQLTVVENDSGVTHMVKTDIDDIIAEKLRRLAAGKPTALDIINEEWRRRDRARAGKRK